MYMYVHCTCIIHVLIILQCPIKSILEPYTLVKNICTRIMKNINSIFRGLISLLQDILSSVTLSHGFSLTNPTDSVLTFHISPPSQPFTLQKRESHITLKPRQKIEVHEMIIKNNDCNSNEYTVTIKTHSNQIDNFM